MASKTETGTGGVTVTIKSSPEVYWMELQNSTIIYPFAIPELYTSITPNPKNPNERTITYGPNSPNFKTSTEITDNKEKAIVYRVTAGDIPSKYHVLDFKAVIFYPKDNNVAWTWTYNYASDQKQSASKFEAAMEDIAKRTLQKLDQVDSNTALSKLAILN
ncbi:hypothetical protein P3X46_021000 [Hevea brasiliensis]|uniref:Bet v I/Major latex protein domain-containing protein n=1 Tax=Hevea brasiliensis TaxID=3981 RepID=A0ABQ9LE36_HEVBR|nr:uncharacterized protein LOC110664360 [Hevea brasiliensis]KAJ9166219.1 hypothetical protein P3X46_021000 [Hevea brasiliensis]